MGEMKVLMRRRHGRRVYSHDADQLHLHHASSKQTDLLKGRSLKLWWVLSVCQTRVCFYVCIAMCALVRTDRE